MNSNLARFLNRLETTKVKTVIGTLRYAEPEGEICMCPLGHLVDIWIEQTPGAYWMESDPGQYFDPIEDNSAGFPSDQMMIQFGFSPSDAPKIYAQNDFKKNTPAQVAKFIREELI